MKDFGYFQIADAQEAKIEADERLRLLDEELRENYIVTLNRFYIVFESIHKYVKDLNTFIEELNAGLFIQQSMEKVFQDAEGKQLMVWGGKGDFCGMGLFTNCPPITV